jgi:tight adherence protein B
MERYLAIYLFVTVALFVLMQAAFMYADAVGTVPRRTKRRLQQLSAGDPPQFLRRRSLGAGAGPLLVTLWQTPPVRWLDGLVIGSGLTKTTEQMLAAMLVGLFGMVAVLRLGLNLSIVQSTAGGVAVAVLLPLLCLSHLQNRRQRRIAEQLPEALDMFVRSLRAGHPVPGAIRLVATEMPAPLGTEFGIVFDGITYGLDLREALQRMTRRVPVPEIGYLAGAIRIQHAAGGSLATVLASLAHVMRERLNLHLKIKALSAESRFSGKILALIPFAVVGVILVRNPDFYAGARTNPGLAAILYFAGFLVFAGILLLRRVVNIRV